MPAKSEKQAKFMRAAAHGWKPKGKDVPSEKVARKFMHTVTEDAKKELEAAAKKAELRGKGGPSFVAGKKSAAKVSATPEKKAATSALSIARGRETQLTKAKEKAETKAAKLKKKVGSLKTTQSKSRKLGKELATNVAQRQSVQHAESSARRERGKLFKQGQEIEKKREKTARVAGGEAERLAANLEHPNLPKLFDRKDLGKETGQKEASPEDVYRKTGIGHTPEEERPGLPAIEKNKKWFKTMLKKHLQTKHVQKPK